MLPFGGHASNRRQRLVPVTMPAPTPGPTVKVYGYQAYWDDDIFAVPYDDLSLLAIFNADVSSTGTLSNTSRWDDAATAPLNRLNDDTTDVIALP